MAAYDPENLDSEYDNSKEDEDGDEIVKEPVDPEDVLIDVTQIPAPFQGFVPHHSLLPEDRSVGSTFSPELVLLAPVLPPAPGILKPVLSCGMIPRLLFPEQDQRIIIRFQGLPVVRHHVVGQ